ncbi:hypothetical protein PG993_010835 [Apiospora rasikravindrae]|uniref:Uncharacterized protein n=1 Tax=Apiospora rasikravindrae TaxID=990691 RepID=A0ABR1SCI6_9PEZI
MQLLLPEPRSSLRQEREEWFKRVEKCCEHYLNCLADYKPKIDQLCTASPSPIPDQVQRRRTYPNWWIKAAKAKGERLVKTEEYGQSFQEFREEGRKLVEDVVIFEKKVKDIHAEFASKNDWKIDKEDPLVHGYYELMTRFKWFETDIQHVLRDATRPKYTSAGSDPAVSESPSDTVRESIRYKSNWIYALLTCYKSMRPGDVTSRKREQWWQWFDWFAVMTLLLLPFLLSVLAHPFTNDYIGLMALGYYMWFTKYLLFVHWPERWTVLWPTYYISGLLATGVFFSVCASHALFALALPGLSVYAEEYTRR